MTVQQARSVWQAVLGELQVHVTRPSYETWLKDTVGIAHHGGEFVVGTPSAFVAEMLEQRMYSLISQTMERIFQKQVDVKFIILQSDGSPNGGVDGGTEEPLPVEPPSCGPTPAPPRRAVLLNPKYVFENFIVGKSNELAHAASSAIAEKPGSTYNPLVIYSDVGLGKTHLLQAIGHRAQTKGLSVIYATAEEFTNHYVKAIREGRTEEFRDEYRSTDVLLLDDIQFLIGKEQTQEGFFHTFNALHVTNKQIVVTSDRPVTSLAILEKRVQSRLSGGLVVDIQSPDYETRLAILRAYVEWLGKRVPHDALHLLAERVRRNVRDLEGSLNRVLAYADITDTPITVEMVDRAIAEYPASSARRRASPEAILEAVSSHFHQDAEAIMGPRGNREISFARQTAMYLMRTDAELGPTAIGRILGGRSPSSVVKCCAKVSLLVDTDPRTQQDIQSLRDRLAL